MKKPLIGIIGKVQPQYGDDIWHRIVGTRGVTGFTGPKGRPLELTQEEIVKMRLEKTEADISMQIGDKVELLDGALKGQVGTIKEINKENLKIYVKKMAE